MANTPYFTKAESRAKIKESLGSLQNTTARFAFDTLQEAQDKWASFSQTEKDELDGKEFTIATGTVAGVNKWDSSKTGGTDFVRAFLDQDVEDLTSLSLDNIYNPDTMFYNYIHNVAGEIQEAAEGRSVFLPVSEGEEIIVKRTIITDRFRYGFVNRIVDREDIIGGNWDVGYDDNAQRMKITVPAGVKYLFIYLSKLGQDFGDLEIYKKQEIGNDESNVLKSLYVKNIYEPSMLHNYFFRNDGLLMEDEEGRTVILPVEEGQRIILKRDRLTDLFRYAFSNGVGQGATLIGGNWDGDYDDNALSLEVTVPAGVNFLFVMLSFTGAEVGDLKIFRKEAEGSNFPIDVQHLFMENIYEPSMVHNYAFNNGGYLMEREEGRTLVLPVEEGQKIILKKDKITDTFRYAFSNGVGQGATLIGGDWDGDYNDSAQSLKITVPEGIDFLFVMISYIGVEVGDLEIYRKEPPLEDLDVKDFFMKNVFEPSMIKSGYAFRNDGVLMENVEGRMAVIPVIEGDNVFVKRETITQTFRCAFISDDISKLPPLFGGDFPVGYNDAALTMEFTAPARARFMCVFLSLTSEEITDLEVYINKAQVPNKQPKFIYGDFSTMYRTSPVDDIDVVNLQASGLFSLYDDLMNLYPEIITKNFLGYGSAALSTGIPAEDTSLPIYEYDIIPPVLNPSRVNAEINEPVLILISNALHGNEKTTAWGTYQFIKQMLENYRTNETLASIKSNVRFKIIPVANPWGFNRNERNNINRDLNRNFNSPSEQLETRILKDWLEANKEDAFMYIDYHCNYLNQHGLSYFIGDNSIQKQIYSSLIRRITPKWQELYSGDWEISPGEYDNFAMGYTQSLTHFSSGVDSLAAGYAYYVTGIERAAVIEVVRDFGGDSQDSSTWFKSENTELGVDLLANYLTASLGSYNQ